MKRPELFICSLIIGGYSLIGISAFAPSKALAQQSGGPTGVPKIQSAAETALGKPAPGECSLTVYTAEGCPGCEDLKKKLKEGPFSCYPVTYVPCGRLITPPGTTTKRWDSPDGLPSPSCMGVADRKPLGGGRVSISLSVPKITFSDPSMGSEDKGTTYKGSEFEGGFKEHCAPCPEPTKGPVPTVPSVGTTPTKRCTGSAKFACPSEENFKICCQKGCAKGASTSNSSDPISFCAKCSEGETLCGSACCKFGCKSAGSSECKECKNAKYCTETSCKEGLACRENVDKEGCPTFNCVKECVGGQCEVEGVPGPVAIPGTPGLPGLTGTLGATGIFPPETRPRSPIGH